MMKTDAERPSVSCCVRWMGVAILLAVLFAAKTSAVAGAISITSPDHPQTFTYGEMIWHQLYLESSDRGLLARITFSNLPYADSDEPRRDEPFDFRFPGVLYDPGQRAFFAHGRHGELIQVAQFHRDPSFGWIDLAPGAKIYLVKNNGRVTATLTATDFPRGGIRWVQMDNNFSLQNLLVVLFREFQERSDN